VVFALVWLIAAAQSPETNAQDTHRMSVDFVPAPCPYRKLYPTGAKPRITRCLRSWETFSN
jgi:hypothetical protein